MPDVHGSDAEAEGVDRTAKVEPKTRRRSA